MHTHTHTDTRTHTHTDTRTHTHTQTHTHRHTHTHTHTPLTPSLLHHAVYYINPVITIYYTVYHSLNISSAQSWQSQCPQLVCTAFLRRRLHLGHVYFLSCSVLLSIKTRLSTTRLSTTAMGFCWCKMHEIVQELSRMQVLFNRACLSGRKRTRFHGKLQTCIRVIEPDNTT